MDVYCPSGPGPHPVVLVAHGYNDVGAMKILGCRFKEMASMIDWARNFAACGMAAVLYANEGVTGDLSILDQLKSRAPALDLDLTHLAIFAPSGHGPLALSLLMTDAPIRVTCTAFMTAYLMDLDGHGETAAASVQFKFAHACAGRSLDELSTDIPMFIARGGRDDMPGLNVALDRFVAAALARNLPITLVNHPEGPHAFDIMLDDDRSRAAIRSVLAFLGGRGLQPSPR
jgi:hypothetical protein